MLKKWIRNLAAALLSLGLVNTAMADRLQDILTAGVIRIGVPLDVPPFGSQNANREAEGFDVDMANMVAKALGVKLELTQITGANRLPFLLTDKVDGGTLIFTNTREQCDKLAAELQAAGQACAIYRGEMDKVERRNNLKAFREGRIKFLISTDLASRGLDVEHVRRVINYHLPQETQNYIHRVGRTARAGRTGTVFNFVTERDEPLMKELDGVAPASNRPGTPKREAKPRENARASTSKGAPQKLLSKSGTRSKFSSRGRR